MQQAAGLFYVNMHNTYDTFDVEPSCFAGVVYSNAHHMDGAQGSDSIFTVSALPLSNV